jgi:hypothetical protein
MVKIEQLLHRVGANDARLAEKGINSDIHSGERAGMR